MVCCARESAALFENYPLLKPIRGQVSWVDNSFATLPLNEAYSYGGYCMQLNTSELILGLLSTQTETIKKYCLMTMCITLN